MEIYGRIYKNFPLTKLLRLKTFFVICKFPILVKNLGSIYNISSKFLGKKIVNKIIKHTYGDIFLAGENSRDLEKYLIYLKRDGLITIADYAREFLTKEEEEKEINEIINLYKESIDASVRVDKENSIAMKISSFGDFEILKTLNTYQYTLSIIENNFDKNLNELIDILQTNKLEFNLSNLNYERLKSYKGNVFWLNFYEILLSDNEELINLIKNILNIDCKQYKELNSYAKILNDRLIQVFNHAEKSQCLVMIDAEQSYLKYISDMIVAHYFKIYNKNSCILAQTLQCYLKCQPVDLRRWHEFTHINNLKLGLKLVRGAYMNEEENIAQTKGLNSIICSDLESTHQNYNNSIEFVFNNYKSGDKFCIATHNIESIKLLGELYKQKGKNENIFSAQLLGIAEHATAYCRKNNVKVAKYVPFGNFDILIPYLIRRAEESSMVQKLSIQNEVLNKEILLRFKRH